MILLQTDSTKTVSWIKEFTDYTTPVNNIAAILIAIFGGLLWSYYKRREIKYQIVGIRLEAYLNSHKAIRGLLKYLSRKEKNDSVFIWNPNTKLWRFNPVMARKFNEELNKIYYTDGNGIMLEKEIRDKLFEIENKILKCLRNLTPGESGILEIKNESVCDEVMKLKDSLIVDLRTLVSKKGMLKNS